MMRALDGASIVFADPAVALGTYRGVVVMIWRGHPTLDRLRRATELVRSHARERGARVGVVSLVEHGALLPGREERAALRRDMQEVAPQVAAAAFVAEGAGLWVRLVLEWITLFEAFRGTPTRERHCTSAEEASAWLATQLARAGLPDVPSREEIAAAVEHVRRAGGGRP